MNDLPKRKKARIIKPFFRNIFICAKNEMAPFATVFTYHPENVEQQPLGTLFGIIKIDDMSEDSSYVANPLTSVIKKEYFAKTHRSAEESFEASLRKANLALAELVRHGSMSWAGKINFAGGSLEKNNLHFSCLGNVDIFLIRAGHIAQICRDLENERVEETHPLKTFSNISSGKLELGDKLIFATRELTEIFSPEEVRQNAGHFSYDEFPGFLEISLGANSELSGVIVVDLRDSEEEQISTPVIPILGREKIKRIDSFTKDFEKPPEASQFPQQEYEKNSDIGASYAPSAKNMFFKNSIRKSSELFRSSAQTIAKSASRVSSILNNQRKKLFAGKKVMRTQEQTMPRRKAAWASKFGHFFALIKEKISGFDYKNKKFLVAGGAVAAILIIFFIATAFLKSKSDKSSQVQAPVANENSQAPSPAAAPADTNAKNIPALETVANLPQNASHLAILKGILFALEPKSIAQVDPQTKNVNEISSAVGTGNFKFIAAMPDLSSLFVLTEDNKIVSLTPSNKNYQENSITLPDNLKPTGIKSYLTYIYILDPANNQIYRYPRADGGFGDRQDWLRSGTDIKNAKSLAVNDDIFAAGAGGILALLQGKVDSTMTFEKPNIPLSIDAIYSEPGFSGIYVLDNKNHRVVQFDKQGKISAQYFNDSITAIKDFTIDEKNKSVYLLAGNGELAKFSLE